MQNLAQPSPYAASYRPARTKLPEVSSEKSTNRPAPTGRPSAMRSRHLPAQYSQSQSSLTPANFGGEDIPNPTRRPPARSMLERRSRRVSGPTYAADDTHTYTPKNEPSTTPSTTLYRDAEALAAKSQSYLDEKRDSRDARGSGESGSGRLRTSPKNGKKGKASGGGLAAVRALDRQGPAQGGVGGAEQATPEQEFMQKAALETRPPSGLVGLSNLGNTCFMNSALQCLFNTAPLLNYFLHDEFGNELAAKSPMKGALARSFQDTMAQVKGGAAHTTVSPAMLKRLMGKWAPHLSAGYSQQDSQEFLRFILNGLSEDLNNARGGRPPKPNDKTEEELMKMNPSEQSKYWWARHYALNNSFVTTTFSGQFMSTVTCSSCGCKSYSFDPFFDLSLAVAEQAQGGGLGGKFSRLLGRSGSFGKSNPSRPEDEGGGEDGRDLEDLIRGFTSEEVLDGEFKTMCSVCKKKRKSTKKMEVLRCPPILVLHLKRFADNRGKLETKVKFPLKGLDMSQWFPSGLKEMTVPPIYDLYAISNHIGGLHGGHYTAHCLNEGNKQWYHFNDSHVHEVDQGDLTDGNLPYLLFYKRRDVK